jgi:ABC-type transport system substrate-binding protein
MILKAGTAGGIDRMDPCAGPSGRDYTFLWNVYDTLTQVNYSTGKIEPDLATSWKFLGSNHTTVQLTLRSGVRFTDGTPLTAAAVQQSIEHCKAVGIDKDVDVIKSVSVVNPNTVQLQLTQPDADILYVLADRPGMIVSPTALAKYGNSIGIHPVGTGPYMVTSYTPGTSMDLVKNPNYWNPSAIHFAGIDYTIYQSAATAVSALEDGQIQDAFFIPATTVATMKSDPQLKVIQEPSAVSQPIVLNDSKAPLNNVLVRQAMNIAVNRSALSTAIQGSGVGGPTWLPFPPGTPGYDPAVVPTFPYNPTKAKSLLSQAGYPNGFTLQVCANPANDNGSLIAILKQEMAQVGITLDFVLETGSTCVQRFNIQQSIPAFLSGFGPSVAPGLTYSSWWGLNGANNVGNVKFPKINSLVQQYEASTNATQQVALLDQMAVWFKEYAPTVLLYFEPIVSGLAKNVGGVAPSYLGLPNLNDLYFTS